jgi:hypothetical protein
MLAPVPTTADYLLKFARADEHLDALLSEIQWWATSHPYRVLRERDAESDFTVLYIEPLGEPPLKCGVIAGDVVHNLRSALDMLVIALAESNHGGPLSDEAEKASQLLPRLRLCHAPRGLDRLPERFGAAASCGGSRFVKPI